MGWWEWKEQVRPLRSETYAMYFACKDPRVPWYAKLLAAALVGYVFSPVDLFPIPDFVPVLGQLDELIVVPVGVIVVRRMIPERVMAEARAKAKVLEGEPVNRKGAIVIVAVWLLVAALIIVLAFRAFR